MTNIEEEKDRELTDTVNYYASRVQESDKMYNDMIDNVDTWSETQKEIQNESTDFAIEKINQQKDQAHKDYLKEQSGAYVDWQRQSNPYGVQAEQVAAAGLSNATGYKETLQVSMYNTYQNRVATARESYKQAILEYDNSIKEAQLKNSVALAEIAATALENKLALSLQGLQYRNQLLDELDNQAQIKPSKWKDVLNQINGNHGEKTAGYSISESGWVTSPYGRKIGYDKETVKKVQQFLGLEPTGVWNEKCENAANSAGFKHGLDDAYAAMKSRSNDAVKTKINQATNVGYTGINNAMRTTLNNVKTGKDLVYNIDTWLETGRITDEEAEHLYKSYIGLIPYQNREWDVVDGSGDNMKVTDGVNTYTIKQLYATLKTTFGKKKAKEMVQAIQNNARPKS